jgi:hypothetical protein
VIVRFVDISGIVDNHCFNVLLHTLKDTSTVLTFRHCLFPNNSPSSTFEFSITLPVNIATVSNCMCSLFIKAFCCNLSF